MFRSGLFAHDFLTESLSGLEDWQEIETLGCSLQDIFTNFPTPQKPNESQTEDDLIWPVLVRLGWTSSLRQQNLTPRGVDDVPDGLLFADDEAKNRANALPDEWRRYSLGLAIAESKRWRRPLDSRSDRHASTAPSTQMLRYLRRVDDLTRGSLRWGMLTNGATWRLYYAGARSVAEEFFEIDLPAVLDLPGSNEGLFALSEAERRDALKVFVLLFRREAFLSGTTDPRTFHQRALEEGAYYERRVAASLSSVVFDRVFPDLCRAIAAASPLTPLPETRDAALTLLYRLLFILYAEDRELLPVRDSRYDDYGLRTTVREDVRRRKDRHDVFSNMSTRYWSALADLCKAIDQGDPSIGLPPYNGGLFDQQRTPLLDAVRLSDQVLADVIDALSFEPAPSGRRYINYRDLSVQQLGSIYERLLEQELARDGAGIVVRPNPYARKGSGSYFTPPELVDLILRETVGPLVQARLDRFAESAADLADRQIPAAERIAALQNLDPGESILGLRICDPAMGSGHFLVGLVDYLADCVIAAMAEAEATVRGYSSLLTKRIDDVRRTIRDNATARGWNIDESRLDDRYLVRRIVLKRCVYGVDSNPMAVELAKVSLWLHTFTAGAPLSFLDHHLRCGNSLFGCWTREAFDRAEAPGTPLFLRGPLDRATRAAIGMRTIEGLTDAEIEEADRSAGLFGNSQALTAPLDAFLSLIHAFEWLNVRDADSRTALRQFFQGRFGDPVGVARGEIAVADDSPIHEHFSRLLDDARAVIAEQRFFNWQPAFPLVWSDWDGADLRGGFDAVIGNPPWDRMKFQQVEWFAARRPEIALAQRAADRKAMIRALEEAGDPLADSFRQANDRAESAVRVARRGGNYPLLSGGDVNIYSLFVERALSLIGPDGLVGLLTPSGIASDKTASRFFQEIVGGRLLRALYDFENKKVFFPDVHASFKFCALVLGRSSASSDVRYGVFLHDVAEFERRATVLPVAGGRPRAGQPEHRHGPSLPHAPGRRSDNGDLPSSPGSGGPIWRRRGQGVAAEVPHHVSHDERFRPLPARRGTGRTGGSLAHRQQPLRQPDRPVVPAVRGQDGAGVRSPSREHRRQSRQSASSGPAATDDRGAAPQPRLGTRSPVLGAGVEMRLDLAGVGARIQGDHGSDQRADLHCGYPACGRVRQHAADPPTGDHDPQRVASGRQPQRHDLRLRDATEGPRPASQLVHRRAASRRPDTYENVRFGPRTAAEIVRECVLELTYTASDLEGFARDLGHIDETGAIGSTFPWDEERRLQLRAKLDAVFFHLYGVTDRDDVRYVWSTFPIVERQDIAAYGRYRSRDLCLAYMNALAAGRPDTVPNG